MKEDNRIEDNFIKVMKNDMKWVKNVYRNSKCYFDLNKRMRI